MSDFVVARRALKDYWGDWSRDFVSAPPFSVSEYQERLNAICGKSRGYPIMKLEWGGNATIVKHDRWDSSGTPTHSIIMPRFAVPRKHEFLDHAEYIPIRRWIISERCEPEQYRPDDNSDNTFTDENGVVCTAAEKPHQFYTPYIYVGDHSKCPPNCCEFKLCLGDYKHPDAAELDLLLEVTYSLKTEFFGNPYAPINEGQLARINKEHQSKAETRLEAEQTSFDEESRDIWKGVKRSITDEDLNQTTFLYKDGAPI